jgi:hypothetical protein
MGTDTVSENDSEITADIADGEGEAEARGTSVTACSVVDGGVVALLLEVADGASSLSGLATATALLLLLLPLLFAAVAASSALEDDDAPDTMRRGVFELLGVTLGLAPEEREEVGDEVIVVDVVRVPDVLGATVSRAVDVVVAEGVVDGDTVPEEVNESVALELALGVASALGVTLTLAPLESEAVGDTVTVALGLTEDEDEGVGLAVDEDVPLGVCELVGVSAALGVCFPVSVLLADTLGVSLAVRDALSPLEMELVIDGVALAERLSERDAARDTDAVPDGVSELEVVAVGVGVLDDVPLALCEAVPLDESDTLDVIDALAPFVTEPVGVDESVASAVELGDGVTGDVPLGVGVDEPVPLLDADGVEEIDADGDSEPVREEDAPSVSVAVGV